jgi:Uma2 family endonuclease
MLLAMVQTPLKPLTLAAFLQLPETKPASEFVDGQIIQKPMPQGKHSTLQGDLVATINAIFKPQQIARAYPELRCSFDDRSIIPDVAVFVWERIPSDLDGKVANVFALAPDWTIEILSPDQNQSRVVRNILRCLHQGTQMGWLIDPEEEIVFVYMADQTISVFDDYADLLPVPLFAASLQLTVGELFSWLKG